jgi:asparagine synthase (glutamine-hydrolysing)
MYGLAVAIGCEAAEQTVRRLLAGLAHRGDVDDPIVCPAPGVAMGTRRLQIVDPAGAVQPQLSFDGRILLSFNGEIYNHAALRRELEGCGAVFKTQSDTEVLASALSIWGEGALRRFNGMYAFVAIDLATGEFLAARDPVGVKPLYLIRSGDGFVFCSEIWPLLSTVETGDVLLLPPGTLLTRTRFVPFRSLLSDTTRPVHAHDPATLDRLLAAAVQMRLPPDLPAAILFSGGVDSTLIAHYARQVRPGTPGYFLGGLEAPDYPYAARYAEQTGFDMRCVDANVGGDDTLERITTLVARIETFQTDVVRDSLCTHILAKRVHSDGFRVALCGEGADELFAGYAPLEQAFADSDLAGAFVRDQGLGSMHKTNLQRLDRCGMRFQLETRHPFLDPGLIDYALGLAGADLSPLVEGRPRGKAPLRSLYDLYPDQLPRPIRDRRKLPLAIGAGVDAGPDAAPWIDFAEQSLSDRALIDGQRRFAAFDIRSKEELLYLQALSETMDVWRVPHLTAERRLMVPAALPDDLLAASPM